MAALEQQLIRMELLQREQEGCDTAQIASRIDAAVVADAEEGRRCGGHLIHRHHRWRPIGVTMHKWRSVTGEKMSG